LFLSASQLAGRDEEVERLKCRVTDLTDSLQSAVEDCDRLKEKSVSGMSSDAVEGQLSTLKNEVDNFI